MFSARAILGRSTKRFGVSPVTRTAFRRTYAAEGGATDNAFNRERAAVKKHAAESSKLWYKLSLYAVIPALAIASVNAYRLWNEHWEHWSHMAPLEERTEYPYQNLRTKNFFWGDGDKTVFWNDSVNHHKKDE